MSTNCLLNNKTLTAAVLAGIIIGGVAWCVKRLIALISRAATAGFDADRSYWWMIPLGVASIVVSAWVVRKVVRLPLEHSTGRIRADLAKGSVPLSKRLMVAPVTVNALTLGLGGSAGAEGPIAYTGAAIASRVAKWFGLSEAQMLTFLACGAGAGIAAIFKAPMGGVFFTIEVLQYSMGAPGVILLVAMCLSAGLGAYAFGGFVPNMEFVTFQPFALKWYAPALLLGLWCGVYSRYYAWTGRMTSERLARISSQLRRSLIAGSVLGALLFLFPALYGEGYGVLAEVLNGNTSSITRGTFAHGLTGAPLLAAVLAGVLLVKGVATYVTNSGGGVAGEFAPTIFAGGMAGALFVIGAVLVPGWESLPAGDFVLLAMAGVMAGAIKAPLMAIFIVAEMTGSVHLLLPLCIVCAISYFTRGDEKFSKTKTKVSDSE